MSISNKTGILITGAHGFLGHHVMKEFMEYNEREKLGLYIFNPTREHLDLLNPGQITHYLKASDPDIVIHLAAQCGGIGANRDKPGEFVYNNLMMATNLIEACRNHETVKKFVGLGTVCSYPKYTKVPFKEEDLFEGYPEETNAPYGNTKRMQLEMLKAYRTQYGFNGIFLVPVNMYGEWDNFDDASSHVIPAMMKKFHRAKVNGNKSVVLWGDGSPSREFLYAGDCARAILQATIHYNGPDPVNIGTGREITIRDLAFSMKRVVGYDGSIEWDTSKPNGQPRRCLDVSKARELFGFEAKAIFQSTLINTYKWAQENGVL